MKRFSLLMVALLALLAAASAQYKFTTIECPGMHVLYIDAIFDNGKTLLAGYNTDADPVWRTLIIKHGKCMPLAPNTLLGTKFNMGYGMNEHGDVVGIYSDGSYGTASHGYLVNKNGVLTKLDFPTADSTFPMGINASGTVVGQWAILDADENPVSIHGFTWKDGVFTDFVMPGAALTVLAGINAQGEYTGWQANDFLYMVQHGFVLAHGQTFNFDVPSAVGTQVAYINDKGQFGGQYWDEYNNHGYVKLGSDVQTIDYPGAMWTGVQVVTNAGQIGGWYYNPDWTIHAFIAEKK